MVLFSGGRSDQIDTKSAMGRFFFTLLAAVAEMERNLISERTVDALARKKENGERCGEIPLGFDVRDGMLVENEQEQAVIRRILAWHHGGISYRRIAERLTSERVRTKKGLDKWNYQTVRNIILRHAC